MRRTITWALAGTITLILLVLAGSQWMSARAIQQRRQKAIELEGVAARLRGGDIAAALSELGPPTNVSLAPASPATGSGAVLSFQYEYSFRGMPWTRPQKIWLTIGVYLPSTQIRTISSDQTFG